MLNRRWCVRILLAVLGAALAVGMARLARFPSGTSYPSYSSLNTGPLGTALLFEGLNGTGRVSASRNYLPIDQLQVRNAVVIYTGVDPLDLHRADDAFFRPLESIARAGNRVVLGVTNGFTIQVAQFTIRQRRVLAQPKGDKEPGNRWGIRVRNDEPNEKKVRSYVIKPGKEWTAIPGASAWEHGFGSGSVLLVSNANRLTNEALAKDDSARALVPLIVAASKTIIFDESHLGNTETGSIAALARRYRLGGLMAGLLIVVALFFWRKAVRFPPAPPEEEEAETVVAARDSQSMLAGLLQRHIARDTLIGICVAEWNRVRPDKRLDAVRWAGESPVEAYRHISEQLRRGKNRQ